MLPQAANVPLPAGARAGPPGAVGPPASRDLYRSFADLLEYPTPDLAGKVQACCLQLTDSEPPAAELMQGFLCSVEQTPLARLEEIFSATFDLQAVCYPYVGYHLFGDSYKRAQFMARLNEGYREKGFSAGRELPDHVAVVLRFLALGSEDDFSQALLGEGLIPALDKMGQSFGDAADNPYAAVIQALLLVLRNQEGDRL